MARIGIGRYTRWRIEGLTSRLDSHSEKHENIFSHHYKRSLWRIVRFSRSVCQPIVAQCLNPLYLHPSYKMDGSFLYWDPVFLPECHMSPIFVSARARLNTPLFLLDYNNQEGVLYSVRRKTSQALNAIDYKRRRCRPFE
ncbi:hypothetical protein OUZ56_008744 [Daphnia magna]|uniref:Uncharacterized protein n=1 Tax=Daphnia magna TaxID=35525 RepID=A0ABR0ADX7_9CRUS|nr:hypothetical protein OUZ56_008744 [Daphnia magna]